MVTTNANDYDRLERTEFTDMCRSATLRIPLASPLG